MATIPIPGARPLEPRPLWPSQHFSNETEVLLHMLIQHGWQTAQRLQSTAPHFTLRSVAQAIQRGIEQGTIRPVAKSGTARDIYRITNKGRWALREHWAWRMRYEAEQFPDDTEDGWGMLIHKGRVSIPQHLQS